MRARLLIALAAGICLSASPAAAQEAAQRAYTDGTVVAESYVRTKPGMFNQYMNYLQSTWKPLQEAAKQAGIITDYYVMSSSDSRGPSDHDLVLVTVYPNWAALDGLEQRVEPIVSRLGTLTQRAQAAASREEMRQLVGFRMFQRLELR